MGARDGLQRDWSSLPPELLNLIAKNLIEIFDFVRFRAVCIAWRLSIQITDLSSEFPWILDVCKNSHTPDIRFYSIHFNKMHIIHSPKMLERQYRKLSEEYLFVYPCLNSQHEHRKLSLLNPFNNNEILLTSLGCRRHPLWWGHQKNEKGEHVICYGFVDDFDRNSKYFACHIGHENWRALEIDSNFDNSAHFLLKSMIFCVEMYTGVTKVVDITTGKLTYVIPAVEGHLGEVVHLLEVSGDILRVGQYVKQNLDINIKYSFRFHRLVLSGSGSPYWVKVEGISGHALFIDWNGAFSVKANDLAGIGVNCVYLLQTIYEIYERISYRSFCVVERIEIETGARQQFPCPLKNPKGWFIPKLVP